MATPGGNSFLNPLFQVVSFGAGTALGPVLRPVLQDLTNQTWALHPVRRPDAVLLAQGVAQGQIDRTLAEVWARETGYGVDQLNAMVDIANVGPGMAQAFRLWRRNQVGEAGFRRALLRLGLEQEWIDDLWATRFDLLDPAVIASAIQRSLIPDPGYLPVHAPTTGGKVPPMPVVDLDAVAEAKAAGLDSDHLAVMTRLVGLPASPDLAARMTFRKIIERTDFDRAIAEGNTRNEWADSLFDGFREILTANQYAELQLRGYYDEAVRRANTAKHGMSQEDSDLLYNVLGRSVAVRQVTTGLARGGAYPGNYANVPQPYRAAIQRGNLREEYSELAYANRYTYPSGFQIRAEAQGERLTPDETYQLLLEIGWSPKWARHFADAWTGGATTAATDPHVAKAETQLWGTTHRSYMNAEAQDADARTRFDLLGIPAAAQDTILNLWKSERDLRRKQLTATQIKKAYLKPVTNPATGAPWTYDDALATLVQRGWPSNEAATFLSE